jgi:dCTP deaminase
MGKAEIWTHIPVGTIRDADIVTLAKAGESIIGGFNEQNVKQACYELCASNVFYETAASRENKRLEIGDNGYILRPHSYVTSIVQERIQLPANVLGRILTKGQLFSIGILPVCTYADPGFAGRLGITLCNVPHRHIVIKPSQPIAKIEFSVLSEPVTKPYTCQHGYETQIWPIPVHLYADEAQLHAAGIKPKQPKEIAWSYGPQIAAAMTRLEFYERWVWVHIAITVLGFVGLFAIGFGIDAVAAILLGVVANMITNLVFYIVALRS